MTKEDVARDTVERSDCHPHRGVDVDGGVACVDGTGHRSEQPGSLSLGIVEVHDIGEQDGERIATDTRRRAVDPKRPHQPLGDFGHNGVADGVSEAGVDLFEPVEVEYDQRCSVRACRCHGGRHACERGVYGLIECDAVCKTGQRVVGGVVLVVVEFGGEFGAET